MESHVHANGRTTTMIMTVDEFLIHPVPDGKAELVRGDLRVTPPAGAPHAMAARNLVHLLDSHTAPRALGLVFPDGTGYELVRLPHTVRVPDASFVPSGRLPEEGVGPGLFKMAPDLAVEVLSPNETASELEENAGAPVRRLRQGDTLDGGDVIPDFSRAIADIFKGIARNS